MKNQVAGQRGRDRIARPRGLRPPGDLVFVAAADEEVGDNDGLQWLVREHPDAVRVDYAVNEGGGERVDLGGRALLPLRGRGEDELAVPGDRARSQRPARCRAGIADNALVKAAPLIEKLAAYEPEASIGPEVEASSTPCSASSRRPGRCWSGCAPSIRSPSTRSSRCSRSRSRRR